ncbi:ATP-dependent helicase [Halopolyspora algeriensis]|uniref:ATP-dependent helicase n=1 Tax=Halopolyspora algeriensis TaxID=1500506 RepID=UPI001FE8FDCD|nr:ATP-dependent DNA helicase [Halopolyspora algeriensis]
MHDYIGDVPISDAPTLVRRADSGRQQLSWDAAGQRVLEHTGGFLRLLGGPGTGKTTLLAEVVADRVLHRHVAPENILVLTPTRRSAARLRAEITRRIGRARESGPHTTQEPLVRSVHSYAFGVLRLQAAREGRPPPRLLNGPQQDVQIRELLDGDLEEGAGSWPEALRPALSTDGFRVELRELLMRAAERGLGPAQLRELGSRHDRPEWIAAGGFGEQYERVTLLAGGTGQQGGAPAFDAAELISSALLSFDTDPGLLEQEQGRVRLLLVDDAQNLDPQQFRLCVRLGNATSEFLLSGDPDQAVYAFRGADSQGLRDADPGGDHTQVLTVDHRMSEPVRAAVQRLASHLPGSGPQRDAIGAGQESGGHPGAVQVRLLASQAQEAAWIADQLRRAHLLDGVPWSRMAVIVKSTKLSLPVLRRALPAAGVPLALPVDDVPLAQRGAVRPLLTLLRCAVRPEELGPESAEELLTSPLGGADPLALRRLRRGLRRLELAAGGDRSSGELLVEVLQREDRLAALEDAAAEPAHRIAALLRTGAEAVAGGQGIEETLWRVWKACDVEQYWLARSERGGASGAQADRDLDAVVALFDAAAQYADRHPGADAAAFADHLASQHISGDSLAPSAPAGEAVTVATAHAATGQEWDVVAIPGVQEGVWPDLRLRGSLLGVERLVDVLSGVDDSDRMSATAPLLADERRLLLVAAGRARDRVLVSAVRGEDEQPSRFLDELEGVLSDPDALERPVSRPERGLALPELVGELRQVACDGGADLQRRERAAAQLARLAAAGVPGAHPDAWYGLPAITTSTPLVGDDEPVRVSPSTVDTLATCPLRWMLERHGGQDAAELASVTGTLVHALVQSAADGADAEQLRRALDEAWESVDAGAPWFSRRERQRVERMLDAFLTWLESSRGELTQAGVETDLDLKIPAREGGPWLRLRGRVDRLETDSGGRPVVVDVKTAKNPVSKNAAQEHPQLAVYQLAAALGAFGDTAGEVQPGGARLLYVAKPDARGAATERSQAGLDDDGVRVWLETVHDAAASSTGPVFAANENSDCPGCPVRTSCPVHPEGRQVGQ